MKQCPFCAEDIKDAAIVCKHCGRDLPTNEDEPILKVDLSQEEKDKRDLKRKNTKWVGLAIIIIIFVGGPCFICQLSGEFISLLPDLPTETPKPTNIPISTEEPISLWDSFSEVGDIVSDFMSDHSSSDYIPQELPCIDIYDVNRDIWKLGVEPNFEFQLGGVYDYEWMIKDENKTILLYFNVDLAGCVERSGITAVMYYPDPGDELYQPYQNYMISLLSKSKLYPEDWSEGVNSCLSGSYYRGEKRSSGANIKYFCDYREDGLYEFGASVSY